MQNRQVVLSRYADGGEPTAAYAEFFPAGIAQLAHWIEQGRIKAVRVNGACDEMFRA